MTREEALKHIQAMKLMLVGSSNQPISDAFYALEMAEEALERSRWIPTAERLPENDGVYLVTTVDKGQVQMHVFNHNGNSEEYWKRCNKAWMPLPPAYKAESEES